MYKEQEIKSLQTQYGCSEKNVSLLSSALEMFEEAWFPYKQIVISGSSSVGKTSLVDALSDLTGLSKNQEAAREIMTARGWTREDLEHKTVQAELQRSILEQQIREYEQVMTPTLYDRGMLDTLAYAQVYGVDAPEIHSMKQRVYSTNHTKDSVFFHVLPQKELLTDDGFRKVPEQKEQVVYDQYLRELFSEYGAVVFEIKDLDMLERCLAVTRGTLSLSGKIQ